MSDQRITKACSLCGEEKACTPVIFVPVKGQDKVNVKPYTGIQEITYDNEQTLYACESCGQEQGKTPVMSWIVAVAGTLMTLAGIMLLTRYDSVSGSGDDSLVGGIMLIMTGWLAALIGGCILVPKMRHENGTKGMFLPFFLQFFPVFGLIALAVNAAKINRCARAVTALKPAAETQIKESRARDEAMARRMESGAPLTEEEQRQMEAWQQEKEEEKAQAEAVREKQAEQANSNSMRSAIFGIIFTVILGVYGASVYSSGRGVMAWFGVIELSPTAFALVIAAFIVFDIIALAKAIKNKKN